jgi:hypothetical protein
MKLFTFFDENTSITHCLEILGPETLIKKIEKDENEDFDFLDLMITKIQDKNLESLYGVHDVSYSGEALFGFTTYEVHAHKWNELMKVWKEILTELGLRVGKYYKK